MIAFTGSILASGMAQATLIVQDSTFGVGSITFDEDTNLAWLDLQHTLDYSYNELQPEFSAGGVFVGYRLATGVEVLSLFESAGIPQINVSRHADNEVPAQALINNFIGQTKTQMDFSNGVIYPEAIAITADLTMLDTGVQRYGIDLVLGGGTAEYSVGAAGGTSGVAADFTSIGAWLVQDATIPAPVPVPASIAFFSTGLLGLGFRVLKRKNT